MKVNKRMKKKRIDIVIPVLNEEVNIPLVFERVAKVFTAISQYDWRIIYVDDGSTDRTTEIIETQIEHSGQHVSLIQLSRNFGHQPAITAGMNCADGEAVVVMDCDMQDPPELISSMVDLWSQGNDIVIAQRSSRQEIGLRRFGFDLFHRSFHFLANINTPRNTGVFGLYGREVVTTLVALPERHRFMPGLAAWVGFKRAIIHYEREARHAGEPKQNYRKLIRYALDAVFSFSLIPLRMVSYCGLFISFSGFIVALHFVIKRMLGLETAQTGFTTLATLALLLGGVQLLGIGVLGEYLGRIYDEVKARPLYVVKKKQNI